MTERPCPQEGGALGDRLREAWEWDAVLEQVAGFGWTKLDVRCAARGREGGGRESWRCWEVLGGEAWEASG